MASIRPAASATRLRELNCIGRIVVSNGFSPYVMAEVATSTITQKTRAFREMGSRGSPSPRQQ